MSIIQGTSKSSAATFEIEQSIRFNDGDSPKLTGGTGQTGDGTQWTISMWVKRGAIDGSNHTIWSAGDGSNKRALSRFVSGGSGAASEDISFSVRTGGSWYELNVDQSFVDPSAWYHFVWVWDSDNGTAADRMRIYVNGERLTSFSNTPSYPASGTATDSWNNSTYAHQIGFENNTRFFDGYLAEMYHIDGQALTPTSFGETNSDTGQWVPINASSLTFGTRGFYLKGEDSSDLGNDSSGNNNDFTSSGLAAADQVTDSPTDNHCTLNPLQEDATGLSDGNLQFTTSSTSTHEMASATIAQSSGKWYCEVTCNAALGSNARIGIIPNDNDNYSGSDGHVGDDAASFAYVDNGQQESNNSQSSYGASYANGDVIAIALNLDDDEVTFYKNGASQGAISITAGKDYRFAASQYNAGGMAFNFGQASFSATPPTGFQALSTANLPDPTIADPSAYFQATTYTGNGSSQSINQAGNSTFEPSMVWIKSRSAATDHVIQDQVRGNFILYPNQSSAEGATGGGWVSSFDSDGFTVASNGPINDSGKTFVGWQWKAAGSGSSNTDGATSSTVSADTTSGFSIVTWTGTGANTTVGHGLGVAPQMIIVKNRADADSWVVYHEDVGATKGLTLDGTAAATTASTFFNDTAPTSSVFSVGSGGRTNGSSDGIVAYCFANIEGYSKFGSFEGNGSSDGPFVYTGFKPRWVMIKRYSSTESWPILDTARASGNFGSAAGTGGNNPTAGNDLNAVLVASTSSAEEDNPTGSRRASYVSNGFKVKTTNTAMNANGSDYIYMAFGESPLKTATAR